MAASRRVLLARGISAGKILDPAAWNYDNVIGDIWLQDKPSGYDNAPTGQVEVREPTGSDGGVYDNRT